MFISKGNTPSFFRLWKNLTKPILSVSKHSFMDKTVTGKDLKPCETGHLERWQE